LKLRAEPEDGYSFLAFRATSKRTRIETIDCGERIGIAWSLSEQHPREQGLKLEDVVSGIAGNRSFRATSKRTRIETAVAAVQRSYSGSPFRATSKRTRIETLLTSDSTQQHHIIFQSNIQENKD